MLSKNAVRDGRRYKIYNCVNINEYKSYGTQLFLDDVVIDPASGRCGLLARMGNVSCAGRHPGFPDFQSGGDCPGAGRLPACAAGDPAGPPLRGSVRRAGRGHLSHSRRLCAGGTGTVPPAPVDRHPRAVPGVRRVAAARLAPSRKFRRTAV